jgi:hypothetical protein
MAGGKTVAAQRDAWICFEDEAGQTLRPPKARTWGRRGHTPVVQVSGKGSGRISIAGLACYKPAQRSRLIYRTISHRARKGERRSFAEADYIACSTPRTSNSAARSCSCGTTSTPTSVSRCAN